MPIIEYCAHLSPPSTDSSKKVFSLSLIFEYKLNGEPESISNSLEIGTTLKPAEVYFLYSSLVIII